MSMPQLMGWTPAEWEVARAFYCTEVTVDWSLTWLQQAHAVRAVWLEKHSDEPKDQYITYRLTYQCRPMDFQWVAMLFAGAETNLKDQGNWFPKP